MSRVSTGQTKNTLRIRSNAAAYPTNSSFRQFAPHLRCCSEHDGNDERESRVECERTRPESACSNWITQYWIWLYTVYLCLRVGLMCQVIWWYHLIVYVYRDSWLFCCCSVSCQISDEHCAVFAHLTTVCVCAGVSLHWLCNTGRGCFYSLSLSIHARTACSEAEPNLCIRRNTKPLAAVLISGFRTATEQPNPLPKEHPTSATGWFLFLNGTALKAASWEFVFRIWL